MKWRMLVDFERGSSQEPEFPIGIAQIYDQKNDPSTIGSNLNPGSDTKVDGRHNFIGDLSCNLPD